MRKSKQRACSSVLREFRTSLLFRTRRRREKSQNKVEANVALGLRAKQVGERRHIGHIVGMFAPLSGEKGGLHNASGYTGF